MLSNITDIFHAFSEKPAIICRDKKITYGRLSDIIEKMKKVIDECCSSKIIILYMNRSPEALISILSIVFSDHVFCCVDVNTPFEAMQNILIDTESNFVITNKKNASYAMRMLEKTNLLVVDLTDEMNVEAFFETKADHIPPQTIDVDDVSHIIYTSGSTNQPKGVLASKKALYHFLEWEYSLLRDRNSLIHTAQISTPWFDPYARDIFLPLLCGGSISVLTHRELFDSKSFFAVVKNNGINTVHIVPTLFRQLFLNQTSYDPKCDPNLLIAGEMLFGCDIEKYYMRFEKGALFNLYGPTETTMSKFFHTISPSDGIYEQVRVGHPLPGAYCRIINDLGNNLQQGEVGEIVIGTRYASHGYLNNEELNNRHFLFGLAAGFTEYSSADMGRILADGSLEIIGRKDGMKKIYGQKVYAEEVEMVILQYEAVKKVLVMIDDRRIIALIEASDEINYETLDCLMAQKLMHYKIPEAVYRVSMIPLNRNGKVDRKRNLYDGTIPWLYQHKVKIQMQTR